MDTNLPTELYWMTLSVAMTAIFFVPYVVYKILETGLWNTLKTPDPEYHPNAEWASRAKRAHNNAVENLVIFCPLVLAVVFLGKQNEITAMASMIFFYARLTHSCCVHCEHSGHTDSCLLCRVFGPADTSVSTAVHIK